MHRRRLLALALPLLGGCSNLPNPSGPRTPPTPSEPTAPRNRSLGVTDLDVEAADDGHLQVLATVTNPSNAERTRTLRVRVRTGDVRSEQQRQVSVGGGKTRTVTFEFEDIPYDDFSGDGSLNTTWL
mgnify:CR=1 FL=1